MQHSNQEISQNATLGIQEQLRPYLNAWVWFLLSVIIALGVGYFYVRYATMQYQATGIILIKDTQPGDGMSELGALEGIGILGNSFNTVENEIEILKSRRLIQGVVEKLKLHTEYIREGNVKNTLVYKNAPLLLSIVNDSVLYKLVQPIVLNVEPIDNTRFSYKELDDKQFKSASYGVPVTLESGLEFFIVPNNKGRASFNNSEVKDEDDAVTIKIIPMSQSVAMYHSQITATKSDRKGSIVSISITNPVKEKAQDIINELIAAYNQDAINDANLVSTNTARFIDERLMAVKKDLDSVETNLQRFKNDRNITELVTESAIGLQQLSGLEGELVDLQTQKSIANSLKRNIELSGTDFIPENVGIESGELAEKTSRYNKLLLEYRTQLKYATPESPLSITLKSQLDASKQGILSSLDSYNKQLDISLSGVRKEFTNVGGKIATVPLSEKLNRGIERNRSVIESIYLLLSERREATAISLAITAPKAKVVDEAYAPDIPVSPKPTIIYLACLIIGLLLPFGIIYLKNLLYDKIESRRDLEKILPQLGILGEIPKLDKGVSDQILTNDRSVLAESFRILRTNLQFKLSTTSVTNRATRILVTSTVKGEGKTFVSYNLAATLANSGNRVVLVGGDIRNPQIHRYLDSKDKSINGVTEFLINKVSNVTDLITPVNSIPKLDVILSGTIPPNPAELWMQGRTVELFDQLDALYDVILVDSSPTILVTDTLLINNYADITVYVTRANYTDKPLLSYIKDLVSNDKLKNVGLVINDVKSMNLGYGNKYGYTYNEDKKSKWGLLGSLFSKK